MKKIILSTVAAILATSFVSAQSVSLTNTFGGNEDNNGTSDFLKFDEDGLMDFSSGMMKLKKIQ